MAAAIRRGRPHRVSGTLALHVLEVLDAFERSSLEGRHIVIETRAIDRRSCRLAAARRCSHDQTTMRGPAIFLAQFAGDAAPFNSLRRHLPAGLPALGYKGVQIPSWDARLFDLDRAADSDAYCDEVKGTLAQAGVQLTELSTHLQGQLVAVHPAYDEAFDGFAPAAVRGNPSARQAWAVEQLMKAARASARLGLTAHATFSGALAWPYVYPWPQRPPGLIETAFDDAGRTLEADPRCVRCGRRRSLLRDPSGRGPA